MKNLKLKSAPLHIVLLSAALSTFGMTAGTLTVDDYCDVKIAAPSSIKDMRPLSDGVSYAAVSDDGKSIETFSYKTGRKTGVLFDIDAVKGDVRIDSFDCYVLSDKGR